MTSTEQPGGPVLRCGALPEVELAGTPVAVLLELLFPGPNQPTACVTGAKQ